MRHLTCRAISTNGPITDDDAEFLKSVAAIPRREPKIRFLIELPVFQPALKVLQEQRYVSNTARNYVLNAITDGLITFRNQPYSWSREQWASIQAKYGSEARTLLITVAARGYGIFPAFSPTSTTMFNRTVLAGRIFGKDVIEQEIQRVLLSLTRLGFHATSESRRVQLRRGIADLLLCQSSPCLDLITSKALEDYVAAAPSVSNVKVISTISWALVDLGIIASPFSRKSSRREPLHADRHGIGKEWQEWCRRWQAASALSDRTKHGICSGLVTAGRWLQLYHPDVETPEQWTLDLALEFVGFIGKLKVGELTGLRCHHASVGAPLMPHTQNGILSAMRRVFRDLQQWEWIETRFRPERGFVTPLQVRRSFEILPRPIDEGFWLKLRASALSLSDADLPKTWKSIGRSWFPFELVRAVAVTWLFSGCRSNEIERLEVGCTYRVRIEATEAHGETGPVEEFDQAMLRVPVSKTRGEFVKPIEEALLKAIQAWEKIRPHQPAIKDSTTKVLVQPVFAYRGRRISENFINQIIIPILLKKSGLPKQDSRGPITSHRARATMATRLYSNESGMGSVEVMKWLGHKSFASTQYYLELTPTKLMRSFHRSGALSEKTRYVSALVDPRPEAGRPSIYYDLGHGWCTNDAYSACKHRMACARCDFYVPSSDVQPQFKRQQGNFIKMLQELNLTEDEREAISGDAEAVSRLLDKLEGAPVPSSQRKTL